MGWTKDGLMEGLVLWGRTKLDPEASMDILTYSYKTDRNTDILRRLTNLGLIIG